MIKVRQHIPAFVSGVKPGTAEVATLAELLALPWVAHWAAISFFHRYSLSKRGHAPGVVLLMAEMRAGKEFWVVAYLRGAEGLDLPEWRHPKGET